MTVQISKRQPNGSKNILENENMLKKSDLAELGDCSGHQVWLGTGVPMGMGASKISVTPLPLLDAHGPQHVGDTLAHISSYHHRGPLHPAQTSRDVRLAENGKSNKSQL